VRFRPTSSRLAKLDAEPFSDLAGGRAGHGPGHPGNAEGDRGGGWGAGSSAHALDRDTLLQLFTRHRDHPAVRMKRRLWARLLTTRARHPVRG